MLVPDSGVGWGKPEDRGQQQDDARMLARRKGVKLLRMRLGMAPRVRGGGWGSL
jgi:hypothetical protein